MAMPLPVDASVPGEGSTNRTCSACTLERKMEIVSSAQLPAPSVARPMIWMLPPAPEFGAKVRSRDTE